MPQFLLVLLAIVVAFLGLTWLLHRYFHHRWVKYVPALVALSIALYNIYLARVAPSAGFQDLARFVLAMMAAVAFVAGLVTALYLEFRKQG